MPTTLRAESYSDLEGDVILICVGGLPTPNGLPVPALTINLTTQGLITSKITDADPSSSSAFTEALLIVNDPNRNRSTASAGNPILACGSPTAPYDAGNAGVCTVTARGFGGGAATGKAYDGDTGHPNVFQGRLLPNSGGTGIQFVNIPFDPPAPGETLTIRITNIRVNSVGITGGRITNTGFGVGQIFSHVEVSGLSAVFIEGTQVQTGLIRDGIAYPPAVRTAGTYPQCQSVPSDGGSITVTEGFPSAFKTKNWSQMQANSVLNAGQTSLIYNGGIQYPADLNQNVPGTLYSTESGFMFPNAPNAVPGDPSPNAPLGRVGQGQAVFNSIQFPAGLSTGINQVGTVSNGTRLAFVFSNIPVGSNATVPSVVNLLNSQASSGSAATGVMVAVNGFNEHGVGGTLATSNSSIALSETGSTTVVYEILFTDKDTIESATIPVTLAASANTQPGTAHVQFGLAPFYLQNESPNPGLPEPLTGAPVRFIDLLSDPADLFSITACAPDLTIASTHTGNFTKGLSGAAYSIAVTNAGPVATSGQVTVVETIPTGLTLVSMAGTGWICAGSACTRSDALASSASYPSITVTVNVAANAPASVTNVASVSGGGESKTSNDMASDPTTIAGQPDLTITKSHTGNFTQGQAGAAYTVVVSNSGTAATSGMVTMTDPLPTGLTLVSMAGTGWTCSSASCSRSDALASSASYPSITVTVNVAANAPASVTNVASVSGGGESKTSNDTASDPTTIAGQPDLTITKSHTGNFTQGQAGAAYTVVVSNSGTAATNGMVTMTDPLPTGLTLVSMAGTGWTCSSASCSRSDALASSASYPSITVTVNVAANAPASVTNVVSVSGGGESKTSNDTASDNTAIVSAGSPDLAIVSQHSGTFLQGQVGETYSITVMNSGTAASSGVVTVTDTVPAGLTAISIAGSGWNCIQPSGPCTQSSLLAPLNSYPPLTLTVNVAASAPSSVTNTATVAAPGDAVASNNTSNDLTAIVAPATKPDIVVAVGHVGSFTQGQINASYSVVVTNTGTAPSNGMVKVMNTPSPGLTAIAVAGVDWNCAAPAGPCTRNDSLAPGASYPAIKLIVNVANDAPVLVADTAVVSGGGVTIATHSASDPTGVAAAIPVTGSRFIPITPCRVADTRNGVGPFGGPALLRQAARDFVVPNSTCGIPANATAYSFNIAVVPTSTLGYLTMWPAGQAQPLVATLNSDGRIKSTAAIVPAGTNGAVSVFVTDATDLILDVNGYFVPASNASALAFYPLAPCRIADTRNANGALGGPRLVAQGTRAFPITASSCGVPASAQAYSLNFAAVTAKPLGYLTAWPAGQPQPLVASLNDPAGTVAANAVIVPAGTGGAVNVFSTNDTDLVIDINGYFAPPGVGGLSFYSLTPCRVLDSRLPSGALPFASTIDVNVTASPCGLTPAAQAYVLNATVVPSGTLGYLTLWPQGQSQPLASTLNAYDGAITNNMAIVPATTGSISAYPSSPTHLVLDIFGYFAP